MKSISSLFKPTPTRTRSSNEPDYSGRLLTANKHAETLLDKKVVGYGTYITDARAAIKNGMRGNLNKPFSEETEAAVKRIETIWRDNLINEHQKEAKKQQQESKAEHQPKPVDVWNLLTCGLLG
jgi:hypothetical protein